jgi:hypothetical protein
MNVTRGNAGLRSARLWRAGERLQAFANFCLDKPVRMQTKLQRKFVAAGRRNRHAERVRSPETSINGL